MRQILSTALVAVVVAALTAITVSAVAQSEPESVVTTAVSNINAHRVDGKHAVGASVTKAQRAGKLVATNANGYLPADIVKPLWQLIQGKPAFLADDQVSWSEVNNKPAGFADGVDNAGVTGITITRVYGPYNRVAAGNTGTAFAACPAGARATGGGFDANHTTAFNVSSSRASDASHWYVAGRNTGQSEIIITANVVCIATRPAAAIAVARTGVAPAVRR